MDKLEKALEKSRQQRAMGEPSFVGLPKTPKKDGRPSCAYVAPTGSTAVDAAQMERNRIVAYLTRSADADVYRQLRTQVLQIMNKSGFKTLAITSPRYGDGKTTVALNLGIGIALDIKQTVLLTDLDLRKPNLHKYLGMPISTGLTDHLINGVPLPDCLTRPPFDRVNVLPAGTALDNSSEMLGSPQMTDLAQELKTRYPDRLVIYDMPPVLEQDDSIAFLPQVDAVLVVVRDGVTRTDDIKRTLNLLSGANVIGTVLNNCW